MDKEADIDYYRFEAKKGDTLSFEVIARRSQSMLDSFIYIENEGGARLYASDDYTFGRRPNWDSKYDNFVVPADGVYHVSIYDDRHLRGGAEYVYAAGDWAVSAPTFELTLDTDKTLTTPGTSGGLFVRSETNERVPKGTYSFTRRITHRRDGDSWKRFWQVARMAVLYFPRIATLALRRSACPYLRQLLRWKERKVS